MDQNRNTRRDISTGSTSSRRGEALDVEVLGPEDDYTSQRGYYNKGSWSDNLQEFPPVYGYGCLPLAITIALFIICLGQYGVLAAMGFIVFHIIGAVAGGIHSARRLMSGLPSNPWAWRIGNWTISFFLTVWLAGGLSR